jgi:hypothetical protein
MPAMSAADPGNPPSPASGEAGADASDPDLALLLAEAPALLAALSPLGRRVRQPASFLPLQSAEARGKRFNATIGQITDGAGRALPLPAMAEALSGLSEAARSQALLYSPVEGLPELRRRWRERRRRGLPEHLPSSLPLVTAGMTQARALVADLFAAPGRPVLLPAPLRAADVELFALRHQARLVEVAPGGWRTALGELKKGEPALLLLDLAPDRGRRRPSVDESAAHQESVPAAPEGIARGPSDGEDLAAALLAAAEARPLVALAGGPAERPDGSLFWALAGRHANLIPFLAEGVLLGPPGARSSPASVSSPSRSIPTAPWRASWNPS